MHFTDISFILCNNQVKTGRHTGQYILQMGKLSVREGKYCAWDPTAKFVTLELNQGCRQGRASTRISLQKLRDCRQATQRPQASVFSSAQWAACQQGSMRINWAESRFSVSAHTHWGHRGGLRNTRRHRTGTVPLLRPPFLSHDSAS